MSKQYEMHEYADLFPHMARDEFGELVKDIRLNGLLEPITTLCGKVLDGRSRLKACIEAGVEPRFVELSKDQDPLVFVWSRNFARRHLDTAQRALAALAFKKSATAAAKQRMSQGGKRAVAVKAGKGVTKPSPLADGEKGRTIDKLAEMAHVGRGTMQAAMEVERDAPELLEEVREGTLSVSAAATKAKAKRHAAAPVKPGAIWKKVVTDCEKLNADLSAFELSGEMPVLGDFDVLRAVTERLSGFLQGFDKENGA